MQSSWKSGPECALFRCKIDVYPARASTQRIALGGQAKKLN